jgi:DNA-binding SARP family transcriptional activator
MNRASFVHRIVRGVGSCAGLFLLLVGVPLALAALAGWPLPKTLPDPERIKAVLGSHAELPSVVVIKAVAVIGWIAWLELAAAILAETSAQLRHTSTVRLRLPGAAGAQALAAHLVTGVLLLVGTRGATIPVHPLPAVVAVSSTAPAPLFPAVPSGESAASVDYTVKPGDWLSTIARDQLGDVHRYPEIAKLNVGRPQPDGRALRDPDLIHPGWKLQLPEMHRSTAMPAPAPLVSQPEASVTTPEPSRTVPATTPAETTPATPTNDVGQVVAPLSPPPTGTPSTQGDSPTQSNTRPSAPAEVPKHSPVRVPRMVLPAAVGGLAIAGLTRLRANQQRRRPRGRTIAPPPDQLAEQETRVRSVADNEAPAWVDATSRVLWTALEGVPEVPAVIAIRAGALGVEILLDRLAPVPPIGFTAIDGGRTWRLAHGGDLDGLRAVADGQSSSLPALLYIGDTPEGPLWLNLEHAGTLSLEGDLERVQSLMSAACIQVATAPWTYALDVLLVDGKRQLATLDHIRTVGADEAVQELPAAGGSPAAANRLAARVAPPGLEALPPTIVLAEAGVLDADQLGELAKAAQPESGVVLVAAGPIPGATWRLQLNGERAVLLEPLGLHLTFDADPSTNEAVLDLIAAAAVDEDDATFSAVEPEDNRPEPTEQAAAAVKVRILGPVEIDWARSAPRPKAAEIVAYLATRDRPVQGDRLRVDLWPASATGDVADTTFRTNISRARSALGVDDEKNPHLREAEHGAYRLGRGITTDWHRFRQLASLARNASSDEAIEFYREAMTLVRGAPFADVPKGTYHWVHGDGLLFAIETDVAEAAEHFCEILLEQGERRLADWAARQGLKVTPHRENLYRLRMKAAHAAGDQDAIERVYRDLRLTLRALGDLEEPEPETVALYASLTQRASGPLARTG